MARQLKIRVLGELELSRDGHVVVLPQSRKTRALLGYLAIQQSPQRRETLCDLLWELPDDPRGALRWSLSKLRGALNAEEEEILTADRERVYFDHDAVETDLLQVRAACAGGTVAQLPLPELRALLAQFRGPFLAGLDLPNQPSFETWRLGHAEQVKGLELCVMDAIAERIDPASDEFLELMRRRIALDEGDAGAHAHLISALVQRGAAAEAQRQVQASRRMLATVGPFDEDALSAAARGGSTQMRRAPAAPATSVQRQNIRFCTARDGVRIAYAKVGAGAPLLKTANWLNHLEFDWESPVWRHFFRAFADHYTLVRYDSRGNGLSDWDGAEFSLDAFVEDLRCVADAAGLERFPLLAISQGCPVAVEFAVRYPERVSKLVLYGGYARGWRLAGTPEFIAQQEAMVTLSRTGWGSDNAAFRQLFTSCFIPHATPEQIGWFNELQRRTTSPENAARLQNSFADLDVLGRLPHVKAPTLVLHVRGDGRVPYDRGRELAAGIPNARFVTLEGDNHLILEQEAAWPRFFGEIQSFLTE